MKGIEKILIAYDGSACSDAALDDLRRAGLPARVEAIVATIVYVFLPPPEGEVPNDELAAPEAAALVRPAQTHAKAAVREARAVAERAAARVRAEFTGWTVRAVADGDAPAWAIIKLAASLNTDLIIVGSHGHSSAGGRLILGSVSQKVLYEAECSVRVARCAGERREGPARIVVGFNGSTDAMAAVEAVASRAWPAGSEARLINADDAATPTTLASATERLRAAGLLTSEAGGTGDPAHVLMREAERWEADSIFVGTRGLHGFQHLLHGSVSAEVAARAQCSVEVVRASQGAL